MTSKLQHLMRLEMIQEYGSEMSKPLIPSPRGAQESKPDANLNATSTSPPTVMTLLSAAEF